MSIDAGDSTSLGVISLGAAASWALANIGALVGTVSAVIGVIIMIRKYREESAIRKVELEIKMAQLKRLEDQHVESCDTPAQM